MFSRPNGGFWEMVWAVKRNFGAVTTSVTSTQCHKTPFALLDRLPTAALVRRPLQSPIVSSASIRF